MTDKKKDSKRRLQEITFKALKATVKGILFYGVYFVLSMFLAPISEMVPGFQQTIEIFVMVYIFLMIIGELTGGTVFQHFFSVAKALFVILYLIFSLKRGIVGMTFQNMNLVVDLRLFLVIAILLSLLGLAKSMLQAISFINERAEHVQL
jgi:hypothetical protein